MKNRTYDAEFKEKIVKEYLEGARLSTLSQQHCINSTQIKRWALKWSQTGSLSDNRGKGKG